MFKQDLKIGQRMELQIAIIFLQNECTVKCGGLDFRLDLTVQIPGGFTERVEVKDESNFSASGNIVLETRQGRKPKPSGLMISESSVVIHVLGDKAILYRTQPMRLWLRKMLKSKKYVMKSFGKSDNYTAGVILPIKDVNENWFDIISLDDITTSKVFK